MATRFVNSAAETAAGGEHVNYAFLAELQFFSQTVRIFNGLGSLTFNGNIYTGFGEWGSIESIGESTEIRPGNPVVMTVAGVDPAYLALAEDRTEYYQRPARVDIAIFDPNLLLLTPIENAVWEGTMDTVSILRGEGTGTVKLTCESILAIWDKVIGLLVTDEHHQAVVPGDTFRNHISENRDKIVMWGGERVATGTPVPSSRGYIRPNLP